MSCRVHVDGSEQLGFQTSQFPPATAMDQPTGIVARNVALSRHTWPS